LTFDNFLYVFYFIASIILFYFIASIILFYFFDAVGQASIEGPVMVCLQACCREKFASSQPPQVILIFWA
jgi:hypothetical protein